MTNCRTALGLALAGLLVAGFAKGQDVLQTEARPNWPAPPLWHPEAERPALHREDGRSSPEPRTEKQLSAASPMPFVSISPCRILDTRITGGPIASGFNRDANLTGAPCGIPVTAAAVSANFVVFNIVGAPSNGVLKVWPTGSPSTFQALINWSPTAGQIDNASVVPVGTGGAITLQPNQGAGSIDMVIDVNGYYGGTLVTDITPGTGISGGGTGSVSLGIAAGGVTANELHANAVTAGAVAPGQVVKDVNGLHDAVTLSPGSNVTITPSGNTLTIASVSTSSNTPNVVVSRDAGGSFSAGSLALAGTLSLPATNSAGTAGSLSLGGERLLHSYGTYNMFIGASAGNLTMTGDGLNTAMGAYAMFSNTSGAYNAAFGTSALYSNTSGFGNTACGSVALLGNTNASDNTGIGLFALGNNGTSGANTAVGSQAMASLNFANSGAVWEGGNTAVGAAALYSTNPTSTSNGLQNTAVGFRSLQSNTTGFQNTALGFQAGLRSGPGIGYGGAAVTWVPIGTGAFNTLVGVNTGSTAGNVQNCTAVGIDAYCDASNQVRLGNVFVTSIGGQVGWSALSDARAKKHIRDLSPGLDFVLKLRPVEYELKGGNDRTDMGFLAQDVEALLGENYNVLTVGGDPDRTLSMRYSDLIAPLVKGIQEQNRQIKELRATIEQQRLEFQALKARLDRPEVQISTSGR